VVVFFKGSSKIAVVYRIGYDGAGVFIFFAMLRQRIVR